MTSRPCSFQAQYFIVRLCYCRQNDKMFKIYRLMESGRKASVASIAFSDLMSAWGLTSTKDLPLFVNIARGPMTLQMQTWWRTRFGTIMLLCHEAWILIWQISWNCISLNCVCRGRAGKRFDEANRGDICWLIGPKLCMDLVHDNPSLSLKSFQVLSF